MSAFVRHRFPKGFILNEEHIRKIREIIATRLTSIDSSIELMLQVRRSDSFDYKTTDLSEVLKEENVLSQRITELIFRTDDEKFEFHLSFMHDNGVFLLISGENRDAVFVLYSDLKAYIDLEVATRFVIREDSPRVLLIFFLPFLLGMVLLLAMSIFIRKDPLDLQAALSSSDALVKLNFLLERQKPIKSMGLLYVVCGMVAFTALMLTRVPKRIWSYIYPANEFSIGKRSSELERRGKFVSNFIWVIVVGGIMSAVTGWLLR